MFTGRTAEVDQAVISAFLRTEPPATLLAVGGYGRGELFPYSDVDLLLLIDTVLSSAERQPLADFLRILWDSGLRVSNSVHTPDECCQVHEGNLELTISLLDYRLLAGDPARFARLESRFPSFLHSRRDEIAIHLAHMTRGRHVRYGNTIQHLEPNVKEHPGGLRDLHVIRWLRRLRDFESDPLDQARAFLFETRTFLHRFFGRDNNILTFEAQDAISSDPAAWMRDYYRNARQIYRAIEGALEIAEPAGRSMLAQFRDWRSRLSNADFTVSRERVLLRNPGQLEGDPGIIMRLMIFLARHQLSPARDTEERIARVRFFRAGWEELAELLSLPRCANALRAMATLRLLETVLPEWKNIDCLVVRDFYHRYTVDEHTLAALESIEHVTGANQPPRSHFGAILSEIDRIDLLRLAILLHDTGKGAPSGAGDHTHRSVEIARAAMARLGVPPGDREIVEFLIEHHLDLSAIMASRDLSEPSTARQIAEGVGAVERLKLLAVLTYADISAVNPSAMTPWRMEQLWETYRAGYIEFTRELDVERIHDPGQYAPEVAEFLEGFPTRYLKTHSPEEVMAHYELGQYPVAVRVEQASGAWRATAIALDRPFLFASISGALASFGMNIMKAEAFRNTSGKILDTFLFGDPHRTLELNPGERERLEDLLRRAIEGEVNIGELIEKRRRARPPARLQPSFSFSNNISETATLLEVVAEDRPALLYDLTQVISSSGANIEVVLVDTESHRALDVFYVTAGGKKLSDEAMMKLRDKLIEVANGG